MRKLSDLEKEMYEEVLNTICQDKYHIINPDDTLIVLGRIYSTFVYEQLSKCKIWGVEIEEEEKHR